MTYVHDDCGGVVEGVGGPDPPDPDRHGNYRSPYQCAACGERFTVIWSSKERRHIPPKNLTHVDDRGVDPAEVCGR